MLTDKQKEASKRYYAANKEKRLKKAKEYYQEHIEEKRAYQNEWGRKNRDSRREYQRQYARDNNERAMLNSSKKTAKLKGLPFDLELPDIKIPEFCPYLGIKLQQIEVGNSRDTSPSLDRIVPEKGYVKGNVEVISMKANRMKNNGTWQELRMISDRLEKLCQTT